jgi:hypothetical protein
MPVVVPAILCPCCEVEGSLRTVGRIFPPSNFDQNSAKILRSVHRCQSPPVFQPITAGPTAGLTDRCPTRGERGSNSARLRCLGRKPDDALHLTSTAAG